jgi:probable addiction module antidote protein
MSLKTLPNDPAYDLWDSDAQAELLEEAFSSGDPTFIVIALGAVARAQGRSGIAEKAGVAHTSLYKALSETGDPQLSTLIGVVEALGFKLALERA